MIYSNTKNIHSQQLLFTYYNNRAVMYYVLELSETFAYCTIEAGFILI
jgi:hypothetical protein